MHAYIMKLDKCLKGPSISPFADIFVVAVVVATAAVVVVGLLITSCVLLLLKKLKPGGMVSVALCDSKK